VTERVTLWRFLSRGKVRSKLRDNPSILRHK